MAATFAVLPSRTASRSTRSTVSSAAAVCSESSPLRLDRLRRARSSVRSRSVRASQMAEATLMPTSTAPSATSARVRVMREAADRAPAVGIARLPGRRADELGHRLDQLAALDRLGQRPVCAGRKRRFRAEPLPRVEIAGNRDESDSGLLGFRSEEHTSELQSHSDLVCRLLLEKKKR